MCQPTIRRSGDQEMAAYRFTVKYLDGRVETFTPPPRSRMDTERKFGGFDVNKAAEQSLYMAWCSLVKLGKETVQFDEWLDLLEDVEEEKVKEPDPTRPDQPTTT